MAAPPPDAVAPPVDNALDDLIAAEKTVVANQKAITESLNHALLKLGSAPFFMRFHAVLTAREQFLDAATDVAKYALDAETLTHLAERVMRFVNEVEPMLYQVLHALATSYVEGGRDVAFQSALADVDTTLDDFQAFLFLPMTDLMNFLTFFLVAADSYPEEPSVTAALTALQEVASRVPSVEKVFTMERRGVVPEGTPPPTPGTLLMDADGQRLFFREDVLARLTDDGPADVCVWLFTDMLSLGYETEVTHDDGTTSTCTFHVYHRMLLRDATVEAVDTPEVTNAFTVVPTVGGDGMDTDAVTLVASSPEARDSWVEELLARVTALAEADAEATAEAHAAEAAAQATAEAHAAEAAAQAEPVRRPSAPATAQPAETAAPAVTESAPDADPPAPPPAQSSSPAPTPAPAPAAAPPPMPASAPSPTPPAMPGSPSTRPSQPVPVVVETSKPHAKKGLPPPPPVMALPPPPPRRRSSADLTPEERAEAEARAKRMKERVAARKARQAARRQSGSKASAASAKPVAAPPTEPPPGPPPGSPPPPPAGGPPH